jgi:pimeloyl-ACP methyl ester carboxylesterase
MTSYRSGVLCLFLSVTSLFSYAQDSTYLQMNSEVVEYLAKGEFKSIQKRFSRKLQKKIKPIQLRLIWTSLSKSLGEYRGSDEASMTTKDETVVVITPLRFEKGSLSLQLSFTGDEISALWFSPRDYQPNAAYAGQSYGKERLKIEADQYILPAEVMLPRDCNQCPLLVLVHGSGPSDMDEAIGPAKPFKDLAMGLALEGIATLRYDKRSFVAKEGFGPKDSFTIQDETVLDAITAVKLAKTLSYIDSNRIFVAGHSLGAYAAPLIAEQDPSIAGFVMLAGPERQLYEIIPQQMDYIFGLDGKRTRKEKKSLRKLKNDLELLRNLEVEQPKKLKGQVTYWPLPFYTNLIGYSPSKSIEKTGAPFLILQGEYDYQVSYTDDFQLMQKQLSDAGNATFISYPKLDHLFMETEDFSEPMDYMQPRNVDQQVVSDIADWIKKHP